MGETQVLEQLRDALQPGAALRVLHALGDEGVEVELVRRLARSGRTLYGVNSGSRVTQVKLSRDWLRGSVVRQITSPTFRLPTTVQIAGKRLLVVNSQFDKRGKTPELPFTVSAVRRP